MKFSKLPPIIFFHLKRFEYDYQTDSFKKINDKYEYYEDLDLSKYV